MKASLLDPIASSCAQRLYRRVGVQRRRRDRAAEAPAVRHPAPRRADAGQARARGLGRARSRRRCGGDGHKSEEDSTLKEAIGVKFATTSSSDQPAAGADGRHQILEGPRIRQQAIARSFVERFGDRARARPHLDWRGWIDRYDELMRWDVDLAAAGEMDYTSPPGLFPDMHRESPGT